MMWLRFLDSLDQAVIPTDDLVEFPRVKTLVATDETTRFTGRPNEFRAAEVAKDIDDEFVEVSAIGR